MLDKQDVQYFTALTENHTRLNIHQQMDFLCDLAAPLLERDPQLPFLPNERKNKLVDATQRALKRPLNTYWLTDEFIWAFTQPIRSTLILSLNHTIDFLLNWKDPQARDYLIQCSELATAIPGASLSQPSNPISWETMIAWWRSEHRSALGVHATTYLHEMDLTQYGKFLPNLIMKTDLRGDMTFYNQHLTLQSFPSKRGIASAAIIQHLMHGDEIPMDTVMELLGPENPTNTYRPHWFWVADYHAFAGIVDRERTFQFFEQYCQHMVKTDCAETIKRLPHMVSNLEFMCNDRELTFNQYSKRYYLEDDVGMSF